MEYENLITRKTEIYKYVLRVIENEDDQGDYYFDLQSFFEKRKVCENQIELQELLKLILKISMHHNRHRHFMSNIKKILLYLLKNNFKIFSNFEIFTIFKESKLILYLLLTNNLIIFDDYIIKIILKNQNRDFCYFFYPEIKKIVNEKTKNEIKNEMLKSNPNCLLNFEEKRKIGENDSYLSSLIRNDSIEEFIAFVNKNNLSLSNTTIKSSIFETNLFLIKNNPTLIEYAVFFGAIQIFQYLRLNNVNLEPSLWIYAIHSNNGELIHLLEENDIQPDNELLKRIFKESIKCHHNDIAYYIQNQFDCHHKFLDEIQVFSCFRYFNYEFFQKDFDHKLSFYYACKYNHLSIVNILLDNKIIHLDYSMILIYFFFL